MRLEKLSNLIVALDFVKGYEMCENSYLGYS